ncbi:hypothetical protein [Myxococcus sp. Y35]|uniref:hypothetical protein n=1 Tax=Pseudomyxococcus flavus TaxID=3115648 RepID=UPI003CFA18B1
MKASGPPRRALAAAGALAVLLGFGEGVAPAHASDNSRRTDPKQRRKAGGSKPAPVKAMPLSHVPLSRMDVTEGTMKVGAGEQMLVDGPRMRAVIPGSSTSLVELRFTVLGPSSVQVPLASGEMRQQVGLKLMSVDACNVLYAMWRMAPKPGIVVNFKRNPGLHTSRECGNRGYAIVKPEQHTALTAPAVGVPHTLRAQLDGKRLRIWADGTLAWQGPVPAAAIVAGAPVGLRSDNLRLRFQLHAPMK